MAEYPSLLLTKFQQDGTAPTKPPTKFAFVPLEGGDYTLAGMSDIPKLICDLAD